MTMRNSSSQCKTLYCQTILLGDSEFIEGDENSLEYEEPEDGIGLHLSTTVIFTFKLCPRVLESSEYTHRTPVLPKSLDE